MKLSPFSKVLFSADIIVNFAAARVSIDTFAFLLTGVEKTTNRSFGQVPTADHVVAIGDHCCCYRRRSAIYSNSFCSRGAKLFGGAMSGGAISGATSGAINGAAADRHGDGIDSDTRRVSPPQPDPPAAVGEGLPTSAAAAAAAGRMCAHRQPSTRESGRGSRPGNPEVGDSDGSRLAAAASRLAALAPIRTGLRPKSS
jgi:hypothetical protein